MKHVHARVAAGLDVAAIVQQAPRRPQAIPVASRSRPSLRGLRQERESARLVRIAHARALWRNRHYPPVVRIILPHLWEAIVAELSAVWSVKQIEYREAWT